MATKIDKDLIRNTTFPHNGKEIVVRITKHGVWSKFTGQRWDSAYFAPWAAIYDMSAKLSLGVVTQLKPTRKVKRGLLGTGG